MVHVLRSLPSKCITIVLIINDSFSIVVVVVVVVVLFPFFLLFTGKKVGKSPSEAYLSAGTVLHFFC